MISNDLDLKLLALAWCEQNRNFTGLVWWPRRHYDTMSPGDFVEAFDELAARAEPFAAYPIVHVKPKR